MSINDIFKNKPQQRCISGTMVSEQYQRKGQNDGNRELFHSYQRLQKNVAEGNWGGGHL